MNSNEPNESDLLLKSLQSVQSSCAELSSSSGERFQQVEMRITAMEKLICSQGQRIESLSQERQTLTERLSVLETVNAELDQALHAALESSRALDQSLRTRLSR